MNTQELNRIQVKPEYITVDFYRRLLTTVGVFSLSLFLFLIITILIFLRIDPNSSIPFFFIALIPSILVSAIPALSERILVKKTEKWDYLQFQKLQVTIAIFYGITIGIVVLFFTFNYIWGSTKEWASTSLLLGLFAYAAILSAVVLSSFIGFYNPNAKASLNISWFIENYQVDTNEVDFTHILSASQNLSKVAQYSNMEIDPYQLCLGLSISCIQNWEDTKNDLQDLSLWAQKPRDGYAFKKFKQNIVKYSYIASDASECGISEKSHLSLDKKTTILGALIIPFAVTLIAVLLPKLFEILA